MIDALTFLISTVCFLFNISLLLRLLLQVSGADFYNPLCQLIIKITNFAVLPARKIIPSYRNIDIPIVVLALLVSAIKITLIIWLNTSYLPNLLGVLLWATANIIKLVLKIYLFAIIIRAILSFIPSYHSYMHQILIILTEPILLPIRRAMPQLAGLDLSPMIACIAIIFIQILLIKTLMGLAIHLF